MHSYTDVQLINFQCIYTKYNTGLVGCYIFGTYALQLLSGANQLKHEEQPDTMATNVSTQQAILSQNLA